MEWEVNTLFLQISKIIHMLCCFPVRLKQGWYFFYYFFYYNTFVFFISLGLWRSKICSLSKKLNWMVLWHRIKQVWNCFLYFLRFVPLNRHTSKHLIKIYCFSQKQTRLVLHWYSEMRHISERDGVGSERSSVSNHTGRQSCWVLLLTECRPLPV